MTLHERFLELPKMSTHGWYRYRPWEEGISLELYESIKENPHYILDFFYWELYTVENEPFNWRNFYDLHNKYLQEGLKILKSWVKDEKRYEITWI